MFSLCSRAHASSLTVAEAPLMLPTMTGLRARGGRACTGDFIFGVFGALLPPVRAVPGSWRRSLPRRGGVAAASSPAGAPGSGATPGVFGLFWESSRRV